MHYHFLERVLCAFNIIVPQDALNPKTETGEFLLFEHKEKILNKQEESIDNLDFVRSWGWRSTFLIYSLLTSSQGNFPSGEKIEAFHKAPLATITDEAPKKIMKKMPGNIGIILQSLKLTAKQSQEKWMCLSIESYYDIRSTWRAHFQASSAVGGNNYWTW